MGKGFIITDISMCPSALRTLTPPPPLNKIAIYVHVKVIKQPLFRDLFVLLLFHATELGISTFATAGDNDLKFFQLTFHISNGEVLKYWYQCTKIAGFDCLLFSRNTKSALFQSFDCQFRFENFKDMLEFLALGLTSTHRL